MWVLCVMCIFSEFPTYSIYCLSFYFSCILLHSCIVLFLPEFYLLTNDSLHTFALSLVHYFDFAFPSSRDMNVVVMSLKLLLFNKYFILVLNYYDCVENPLNAIELIWVWLESLPPLGTGGDNALFSSFCDSFFT